MTASAATTHPNPGGWGITIGIDTNMAGKSTGRISWTLHNPQGGSFGMSDAKSSITRGIARALYRTKTPWAAEPLVIQVNRWNPNKGDWEKVRSWETDTAQPTDQRGKPIR